VHAAHAGTWDLPVIGEVPAPSVVLIRPDGDVAWASDLTNANLPTALTTWFGEPTTS
jgi:3-(3-hydroxy-phenyl)propionate hydroxylase